ncbi:putative two component, sigma54 specific, transcriptional regulator, Fis family [Thermocrinis albus DSM 14484]|uniref:Putative two component, sigma54 specific, transcriptional regulator, Fis family n=1 Tax=Thermocrinis albus (strain DSM 14484 / JCM 11386 / HI 11/12) TaxID=638303 RepID=D3SL71_THEAH|nr:sigma-54 dependent transcriptional regulator [Thermocrinis albus]ADC89501.1 putative two component, sigma54 specific, transcriptional regulator, Fis family [Thermocrinis albus DSM 14484]
MKAKVLVVDDERSIRDTLERLLKSEGYAVKTVSTMGEALQRAKEEYFHCVLLDLWLPDANGLNHIKELLEILPGTRIVVITGHGNVQDAVRAIKDGAFDFIEKPFSLERLLLTLKKAVESFPEAIQEKELPIVGNSKAIREIKELIRKVAPTDVPVLITGESGTGKELVARSIHYLSQRQRGPFVDINCASIPDDLLEAELFGYEKGAFTSASSRKLGKLELAHSGTLFLDEIGDMSLRAQAKLLRVLETKRFTRLGSNQVIESDFRIISASNKDLLQEVEKGSFRQDLYYRISTVVIHLPPLRERVEDVPLLAEYFLKQFAPDKILSEDAKEELMRYSWKGNVRELKNLMERIAILHTGERITARDLKALLYVQDEDYRGLLQEQNFKKAKMMFEKLFLTKKLRENQYDIKKVAQITGLDLSTLYRKIKQYGIELK